MGITKVALGTPYDENLTMQGKQNLQSYGIEVVNFDWLRNVRKRLADERSVPSYVIFGDNTLRHMARVYPTTLAALRFLEGISEKKQSEFGDAFVAEVATHLKTYPKVRF
jgi:ATP-dependent DNA helicase RecQ